MGEKVLQGRLWSEPIRSGLSVGGAALDGERRRALRERLAAGKLDRLAFEAVTFRAAYPNGNYLRFRDEELAEFAASFVGQPFLRDHDHGHIEARGGVVAASRLAASPSAGRPSAASPSAASPSAGHPLAGEFWQTIELTVPRDIEAFLNGQIDRFSISWYWRQITCSVCGQDWLAPECRHRPGRSYQEGREPERLCELIFEGPRGKEVSAVNAPAVEGTGVRGVLGREASRLRAPGSALYVLWAAKRDTERENGGAEMETRWGDGMAEGMEGAGEVNEEPGGRAGGPEGAGVQTELLAAQREAVLDARLAASGLPGELQELVRGSLRGAWRVGELDEAIRRAQGSWARLEERRTVQGVHPAVSGVRDGLDRLSEALAALIEGRTPQGGVRPLTGIREAYVLLSGDYGMTGLFRPENVSLANVNSTTMAGIVANVLNKSVVNAFQLYPRWWEPVVREENFGSLQTVQWITLGGLGDLPAVGEGAAYTELAWDDNTESAAWQKKGGYLGITLEAMDKDDTRKLRAAPRALAQAAYLSLAKSLSGVFTSNAGIGPTLADGGALFNATATTTPGGHANLRTVALSVSEWTAVKLAMRKQTELNSGERLGGLVVPRFMLVPPDLENTALTILASEGLPGTANNDINPHSTGDTHDARLEAARRRVIVVDLWTDVNNWAAVADPNLYPTIGVGYRFGKAPEIFSVATENSGLMFSNDVMPVKVRFLYAVGPMDYRGLHKSNVAG